MQSSSRAHWWDLQFRGDEKRYNYTTSMWRHHYNQQIWHRVWGKGPLSPWIRIFRTGNHSIRGKCLLITNKHHVQGFLFNIIYLVIIGGCIQLSPTYICKPIKKSMVSSRSFLWLQWNLVCGSESLGSLTTSVAVIGQMVGSGLFPALADKYGRQLISYTNFIAMSLCYVIASVVPWFSAFVILRFLIGAFGQVSTCSYIHIKLNLKIFLS